LAIISSNHWWATVGLVVSAALMDVPVVTSGEVSPAELDMAMSSLRRIFPDAQQIHSVTLDLTSTEKQFLAEMSQRHWHGDTLTIFVPVDAGSTLGYAVVDHVKGKDQLITYLVAVSPELSVKDLEILAYREPYGGEVGHKSWQKQFFGKHPGDMMRPGKEIKNISGATISVRSVTLGVKKVLSLLLIVQNRLPHNLKEP